MSGDSSAAATASTAAAVSASEAPRVRAKKVSIDFAPGFSHVDDVAWPRNGAAPKGPGAVKLRIRDAVRLLVP